MNGGYRWWVCSLVLVASCALAFSIPSEARAQPTSAAPTASVEQEEPPPVSKAQKDEAKRHFYKGIRLLEEEAWSPALAEFMRSRELYPTSVATNNIAIALRKLQRYDEALDMFETLLRDFKVKPQERKDAQKQIVELRALVGTIDIVGAEAGSSIVISGIDRGEFPPVKPLRVPAGTHVVRLYKEGYEPFETRVDVAGGAIVSVSAKLVPLKDSGTLRVIERSGRAMSVLVDNVLVGKTPWQGKVAVGPHVVALRGVGKLGSPPAAATVQSGKLTSLTLVAENLQSQLRVDPTPAGAIVAIDGVDVGSGVWLGRLQSGEHKLEVRANGFLKAERSVTLQQGQREVVAIELDRDEDAPMWRKPSKWTMDVGAGFLVVPTLGGDPSDGCDDACSEQPGVGALVLARGGYELGSGLGFGLELGYLFATHEVSERQGAITPVGLSSPNAGRVSDQFRLQGFLAGANLGYHLGESYPFALRLGAGVMLGQLRDERDGSFTARAGDTYRSSPAVSFPGVTYFYVNPEVRAGIRFAEHFELTASVQVLMMAGISKPKFDDTIQLAAGSDGIARYGDETLMGDFVVTVAPGVNFRADY